MKTEPVSVIMVGDGIEAGDPFRQVMVIGMERKRDLQRLYVSLECGEAMVFALHIAAVKMDLAGRRKGWPWDNYGPRDAASKN